MPLLADVVFAFALLVLATIYEYARFWPRFRAAVAAARPGARVHAYRVGISAQWLFTIVALVIWTKYARPWTLLRLALPSGWRLAFAIIVVLAAIGLILLQRRSVTRLTGERRLKARAKLGKFGDLTLLVPRTFREVRWFVGLSLTAGFCEELLYRGYLPWLFAPWLGTMGAMFLVVIAFGLSHIYQGRKGVVRASLTGAVMAAIVLISNSLIPAMIAHALIDIGSGTVFYLLLREPSEMSSANIPAAGAGSAAGL